MIGCGLKEVFREVEKGVGERLSESSKAHKLTKEREDPVFLFEVKER